LSFCAILIDFERKTLLLPWKKVYSFLLLVIDYALDFSQHQNGDFFISALNRLFSSKISKMQSLIRWEGLILAWCRL
jgi:hypothetical protein